jgi:hypothetical protein
VPADPGVLQEVLLTDARGCVVQGYNVGAGMSPFAGFVGCAVALRTWCHQVINPGTALPPVRVSTKQQLVEEIRHMVDDVRAQVGTRGGGVGTESDYSCVVPLPHERVITVACGVRLSWGG